MRTTLFIALAMLGMITAPAAQAEDVTLAGPLGPLAGTWVAPASGKPVVLILPGSGPTDRDGNNPLGVTAAPYRLLSEALATRGIGTLRADKRGLFASGAAIADPSAVTIADYVADASGWAAFARQQSGRDCVWLLGHSEGGIIALAAAGKVDGLCGLVLVASPGRPLGTLLREQLRANPANAPLLDEAMAAIDRLEAGKRVDTDTLHPALHGLFAAPVQGFVIDLMAHDPAALLAATKLPVLIVQGGQDIQVSAADAQALADAQPNARLLVLPAMNHVLKDVGEADRAANIASYADPDRPLAPGLAEAIAGFVEEAR